MLLRSVPFYAEQQRMVAELARGLWQPGTAIYDLGCSTATTLIGLARALPACERLVGYDNSLPMLEKARAKVAGHGLEGRIELRSGDLNADLNALPTANAGLVLACWTMQFVRPARRDGLIAKVHDGLAEGGAFIMCEKVLTNSAVLDGNFIAYYHDYKRRQGYSELEISRKREALENVLVPYRLEENLDLLKRNGFETVETFFQWFNFAGIVGVKGQRSGE